MSENYKIICQETLRKLPENPQDAYRAFRPVLTYPGLVKDSRELGEALHVFVKLSEVMASPDFVELVRRAAKKPQNVKVLFELGYALFEEQLFDFAATIHAHAYRQDPKNEDILLELGCSLENGMRFGETVRVLQENQRILEKSFLARYLLVVNAILSGDLTLAQQWQASIQNAPDEEAAAVVMRVNRMLARAQLLKDVTPLDDKDLRGWHFVITGAFLLHLSPYGLDEGMNGRYAWIQDTEMSCVEGIQRVKALLATLQIEVPRIFVLPERNSEILAHATARVLNVPLVAWTEESYEEPGLIVAYDLLDLDQELYASVYDHRPGQILWSHATCWTQMQAITADITTFLYQVNKAPWGSQMRFNPETQTTYNSEEDTSSVEVIAERIVQVVPDEERLTDVDTLLKLARATVGAPQEAVPAFLQADDKRAKLWAGSPVPSSRFI